MRRFLNVLLFILFAWSIHEGFIFAEIKNEGNSTVQLEIKKNDHSSNRLTLYPGQIVDIPLDAKEVQVVPQTFSRGDEVFKIRVVQEEGLTVYLKKSGEPYILGKEETAETPKTLSRGKVISQGNVPAQLKVTKKGGATEMIDVLAGQSRTLSEDAIEVELSPISGNMRGDENLSVDVQILNGALKKLRRVGEKIRLDAPATD